MAKRTPTIETLVNRLRKKFPHIQGIQAGEGWGAGKDSIHLGDSAEGGEINEEPAASYHRQCYVHPKLEKALHDMGFFAEWWDAGTLIAYRI